MHSRPLMSMQLTIGAFSLMAAALLSAAAARAAPTPLIPPSVTLQPPTRGEEVPAPPIEATPLPPPTVAGPQPVQPPEAKPAPTQPQAAAPPAASPQATAPPAGSPPHAQSPTAELPPAPPQWPNSWTPEKTADLQVLDKIEGVVKNVKVPVGQSVTYGSLTIAVQACVARPPDQPADAAAFMTITDSRKGEPGFRGWTLVNEPWVSMLQSPGYDVQVLGCGP